MRCGASRNTQVPLRLPRSRTRRRSRSQEILACSGDRKGSSGKRMSPTCRPIVTSGPWPSKRSVTLPASSSSTRAIVPPLRRGTGDVRASAWGGLPSGLPQSMQNWAPASLSRPQYAHAVTERGAPRAQKLRVANLLDKLTARKAHGGCGIMKVTTMVGVRPSLLPLSLVALVASVSAQSPTERAALDSLRDSLSRATDSIVLKRLEATTIRVAKRNRDDPLIHLRLGLIAYRLGEVAGKSHFDDAAGEFEWAAQLRPEWPYPWYGDGLAELALGEHAVVGLENLRQILGKDYLSKAARAFARAVEADPAYAQATVDLARTALSQRIAPRLDLALRAVREAAASAAGRAPAVHLARGRVERAAGDADSALAAFQGDLALGGDSGGGPLEQARTQYYA